MNRPENTVHPAAFTLIELMVVIAIIGLLVGALLPAFSAVRTSARNTQTAAQLSALDAGINLFQTEFGNAPPPSASDNRTDRQLIKNPKENQVAPLPNNGGASDIRISGAQLLVHALIGADGLGTPGFKDFNRDGTWWDDTHDKGNATPYGAYGIETATGQERRPRYPDAGGYVDDKTKAKAKSFSDLGDNGVILNLDCTPHIACDEAVFVDSWDHPILYYKSSRSSRRMVADASGPVAGIYRQEDNGVITGTANGTMDLEGLDFGPGRINSSVDYFHAIADAFSPPPDEDVRNIADGLPPYEYSFARFIIDPSVKVRPTPVKPKSYLMISAGPDGFYGTNDDITNWTRDVQ